MQVQTTGIQVKAQDREDGHIENECCQSYMLLYTIEQFLKDGFHIRSLKNVVYSEFYYTDDGNDEF